MVKVCKEDFPVGSYKKQQGPGFYMDGLMKQNMDILVRNIDKDMQFLGIISGDGTVRNGKSTLAMQLGYYFSKEVGKKLGIEVPFDIRNIVFRATQLIDTAFKLPKYSVIILDEGDDLTAHYFSELARTLKRFFRKCGQLNLFIIVILPNFFEIPKHYALTRSNFLCNVKFFGEFSRGLYDFYGPTSKRKLYILGKKFEDYKPKGVTPDFNGRFVPLYTVNEDAYREKKRVDLEAEDEDPKSVTQLLKEERVRLFNQILRNLSDMTITKLCKGFGISQNTGTAYIKRGNELITPPIPSQSRISQEIMSIPTLVGGDGGKEEVPVTSNKNGTE